MPTLLHQIYCKTAHEHPESIAIIDKNKSWTYRHLEQLVIQQTKAFISFNLTAQSRIGVFLPKQIETVSSLLSISQLGGIFVPINPGLKAPQVHHILSNCDIKILITSKYRLLILKPYLSKCLSLQTIIIVEDDFSNSDPYTQQILTWEKFLSLSEPHTITNSVIDTDIVAILYTSGSTGKPKGVILSHRNIITGIKSVSQYLNITEDDKLLALLPFSFDYGLNQLTTALMNGACCVLQDYLLPQDVIKTINLHKITGLAVVPSLFVQIIQFNWPETINTHLRYVTNSGGKLATTLIKQLQKKLPACQLYLMYGLTEAFRSTYLPPNQVKIRPNSIGKAIPNAKIMVINDDGKPCAVNEPGELVHCGSLVTLGYWNNSEATSKRYKPSPHQINETPLVEMAVWSGDTVRYDEEGYLYFIGRNDEMIKTSGYRVSPTEIEDELYSSGLVEEAVVIGIKHQTLGQSIIAIVTEKIDQQLNPEELMSHCKARLANYMIPEKIIVLPQLPKNQNGKIDRLTLRNQFEQ